MIDRAKKLLERLQWKRQFWREKFLDNQDRPTADGMKALRDLATFCYANRQTATLSTVSRTIDPLAMAKNEGRREVFLYICQQLYLDDATVTRLLTQQQEQDQ